LEYITNYGEPVLQGGRIREEKKGKGKRRDERQLA